MPGAICLKIYLPFSSAKYQDIFEEVEQIGERQIEEHRKLVFVNRNKKEVEIKTRDR
jgi:hypothetical protein